MDESRREEVHERLEGYLDAEGLAAAEGRCSRELDEAAFESAAERYDEE